MNICYLNVPVTNVSIRTKKLLKLSLALPLKFEFDLLLGLPYAAAKNTALNLEE